MPSETASSTCTLGTNSHPPIRHQAPSQKPRVGLVVSPQATHTAKLGQALLPTQ